MRMKNDQQNNLYDENKLPHRIDKALAWLANSRNTWREKCKKAKLQLKRQTLAIKRLKESRDDWRSQNVTLKHELGKSSQKIIALQRRVNELESSVEETKKEIIIVKKKR
jgi:hypothetical protein